MVTSRSLPVFFALLLIVGDPPAAHAQTSFKLGTQFNADAGRIDASNVNWIVGCGSDWGPIRCWWSRNRWRWNASF